MVIPVDVRKGVYGDLAGLALEYTNACYSERTFLTHCNNVLTRGLPHNATDDSPCPFPDEGLCLQGPKSATCSPFVPNEIYIEPIDVGWNRVDVRHLYGYPPQNLHSFLFGKMCDTYTSYR